jgi:hypothetical protein
LPSRHPPACLPFHDFCLKVFTYKLEVSISWAVREARKANSQLRFLTCGFPLIKKYLFE